MSATAVATAQKYQMFINGEWVTAAGGKTFPVFDPSTEQVIAEVAEGTAPDVDRAVVAAKDAFENGPWASSTAQERGRVLFKLADAVRQNTAALAELEARNSGKPIVEAEYDIGDVATCFEYYGGLATKISGQVNPVPDNALSLSLKEPVGVAGQIIPWNYPLLMAAWKLAPALAAGCTCVLKPAEQTPLTILELAKHFEACGLPNGVVNILTGFGEAAGAPLVQHPDVNKIAFTGSASVGKQIVKMAADTVKRVTLELGGKSPNIFFADADFEAAIDGALFGVFINQGEVCSAGSRILVQRPIYSKFVEAMAEKAKTIKLGPPLERNTKMGPLVSKEQYDRVRSYLEVGKKEAKLASGGDRPAGFAKGYYVSPTIFYDVDNSARIAREEIFGPVASVIPFDDEADAIRIANDSPYGLAAAVWTRDIFKAFRAVKKIRAGIVWVNHMQPTYVEAPWGGYKQSGFGRELGPWGLEEYLETKLVHVNLNESPIGWY
ncbi:MAG TPA: aldehyde dehydrogenase family protein [Candidatus Angelobacter sp.]|nr:aldehyde dehydrogenase family protein [Candidatus Angelobacter sp.]